MVLRVQKTALRRMLQSSVHVRTALPLAVIVLLFSAVVLLWPSQEERLTSEEELERLVDGLPPGKYCISGMKNTRSLFLA